MNILPINLKNIHMNTLRYILFPSLVYNALVNDVEELRYHIQECSLRIQTTLSTFERVKRSMM